LRGCDFDRGWSHCGGFGAGCAFWDWSVADLGSFRAQVS